MAKTPNYDINYDDPRLTGIKDEGAAAIKESDKTYDGMIKGAGEFYDKQITAVQNYEKTQAKNQQERTDFTIDTIEQQKAQTRQDYLKEQSGAYVDWQKQSGQYGVNAEKQAAAGLGGTGFSESSQVAMYNTYQTRVATAREAYGRAVLNYDNAIKDAQLQNNSILAEIAYNSLQQQLQLSLEGFQYKNQLLLDKAATKREIDNTYYGRYRDEINQINTENQLAENVRQYNQSYQLEVKKYNESVRQFNQEYSLKKKEFEESIRQFDVEIARLKKKDAQEYKLKIQELEMAKKQMTQEQRNWEKEMALKKAQLAEEKRQFNETQKKNEVGIDKPKGDNSKNNTSYSRNSYVKKQTIDESKNNKTYNAKQYLNALIASGASKDKVSNEIAIALREGKISKAEAQKLRNTFTPRGVAY